MSLPISLICATLACAAAVGTQFALSPSKPGETKVEAPKVRTLHTPVTAVLIADGAAVAYLSLYASVHGTATVASALPEEARIAAAFNRIMREGSFDGMADQTVEPGPAPRLAKLMEARLATRPELDGLTITVTEAVLQPIEGG